MKLNRFDENRRQSILDVDRYDKYLIKKHFKLPPSKDLSLTARKRIFYSTKPVKNKKIQEKFKRSYHRLRCVLSWKFMIDEIKLYGTGSSLFSATFAYKNNFESVMCKKKFNDINDSAMVETGKRSMVFSPNGNFKKIWNLFILMLLIYTFLMMPWILAFEEVRIGTTWFFIELTVDLFFFVDILINLNTGVMDKSKHVNTSRRAIIFHYIKGSLIVDFFSVFPFWAFVHESGSKYFHMVRIVRLTRVARASGFSIILKTPAFRWLKKLINSVEGVSRLIIGVFFVLVLIHFVACFWNYSASLDDFGPDTWIVRNGLKDATKSMKYLNGVYFAFTVLMTVGFGDITAYTQTEMVICIIWEFIGIAFYSFVFGTISSVLTAMDQKNAALSRKLLMLDLFAKDTQIPQALVKKITKEIKDSSLTSVLDYDEKLRLVSNLPKKLRYEICGAMYDHAAKKIFFFQNKNLSFIADIMPRLIYMTKMDHEVLYSKNDFADEMYFLIEGKISFIFGKQNLVFKSMIAGSYFGEIELIEQKPREFGAMSTGECKLLVMPKFVFEYMMTQYPRVSDDIKEVAKIKKVKIEAAMQDIIELLVNVDIKKEKTLSEIAGTLKPYKSKEYDKTHRSSIDNKNMGYLYGLEYENKYLKFNVNQINSQIDRLEKRLGKMVQLLFPRVGAK